MDDEQYQRELQRLASDEALRRMLDTVDTQIMAAWMATETNQTMRREQLWHELAGVLRVRTALKVAEDNATIATARANARDAADELTE